MDNRQKKQLDELLRIADERNTPFNNWEKEFVESLDALRDYQLSIKQENCFDKLVEKHL